MSDTPTPAPTMGAPAETATGLSEEQRAKLADLRERIERLCEFLNAPAASPSHH